MRLLKKSELKTDKTYKFIHNTKGTYIGKIIKIAKKHLTVRFIKYVRKPRKSGDNYLRQDIISVFLCDVLILPYKKVSDENIAMQAAVMAGMTAFIGVITVLNPDYFTRILSEPSKKITIKRRVKK